MSFTSKQSSDWASPHTYSAHHHVNLCRGGCCAGCGSVRFRSRAKKKRGAWGCDAAPTMLVGPRTLYVGRWVRLHKKYLWLTAVEWPESFGVLSVCCQLVDVSFIFMCFPMSSNILFCFNFSLYCSWEICAFMYKLYLKRHSPAKTETKWLLTQDGQWHLRTTFKRYQACCPDVWLCHFVPESGHYESQSKQCQAAPFL